uniref:Uncharacterized protein n=1 Tax=Setaria viridis TaxID=4556 RepID=A0A4U6THI6_SETVI|nr:hypothetical protein SEVIR_8G119340v2 [Setaria viridis]
MHSVEQARSPLGPDAPRQVTSGRTDAGDQAGVNNLLLPRRERERSIRRCFEPRVFYLQKILPQ